jgi:hypothetical protein
VYYFLFSHSLTKITMTAAAAAVPAFHDLVVEALQRNRGHAMTDDYLAKVMFTQLKILLPALTSLQQQKRIVLLPDGCWTLPSAVPPPKAPHPADPVKSFDFRSDQNALTDRVYKLLKDSPVPMRAHAIAKQLGEPKSRVNGCLHRLHMLVKVRPLAHPKTGRQVWEHVDRSIGSDDDDEDDPFSTELKREGLMMASALASIQPSSSIGGGGGAQKKNEEEDPVADLRRQMAAMQQQMNDIAKAVASQAGLKLCYARLCYDPRPHQHALDGWTGQFKQKTPHLDPSLCTDPDDVTPEMTQPH